MKKYLISLVFLSIGVADILAQCAMCRSTVVNNVSNGSQIGLAEGLNTGILYLFAAPYLLVGLIAFVWYKSATRTKVSKGYA